MTLLLMKRKPMILFDTLMLRIGGTAYETLLKERMKDRYTRIRAAGLDVDSTFEAEMSFEPILGDIRSRYV